MDYGQNPHNLPPLAGGAVHEEHKHVHYYMGAGTHKTLPGQMLAHVEANMDAGDLYHISDIPPLIIQAGTGGFVHTHDLTVPVKYDVRGKLNLPKAR